MRRPSGLVRFLWLVLFPGWLLAADVPIDLQFLYTGLDSLPPGSLPRGAVELRVHDGRAGDQPSLVGAHRGLDGAIARLQATSEVSVFVHAALQRRAESNGVPLLDDADLVLSGTLRTFVVAVQDQARRAQYNADVSLAFDLRDRQGKLLWAGRTAGDATVFAQRFDVRSCNEMFSVALTRAFDRLLADERLRRAWSTGEPVAPSEETPRDAVSPTALLEELTRLREQGADMDALVRHVNTKKLSAGMTIPETDRWSDAGMPRRVIRAALHLPLQEDPGVP